MNHGLIPAAAQDRPGSRRFAIMDHSAVVAGADIDPTP